MFAPIPAQEGRLPPDSALPSFADIQSAVGFPEYYAEAARYAVPSTPDASMPSASAADQEEVFPAEGDGASVGIGSGGNEAVDAEVHISFGDDQDSTNRSADTRFAVCTWLLHNIFCA